MKTACYGCARTVLAVAAIAMFLAVLAPPRQASAALIIEAGGWEITMPAWAAPVSGGAVVVDRDSNGELVIQIFKRFLGGPDQFGNMPVIAMSFTQVKPDAQTASKIIINDEVVRNNTTVAWIDFHWKLVGYGYATFDREETFPSDSGGNASQDFYINPFTQHSWTTYAPGDPQGYEILSVSGGLVPVGDTFTPGDLQGNLVINVDLAADGQLAYAVFDLKETPSVPEPATVALLALGGLSMMAAARRRRRTA